MIDNTSVLSKPLAYGLVAFGLLFSVITISLLVFANVTPPHYNQAVTIAVLVSTLSVMPSLVLLATRYGALKLPALVMVHLAFMAMLAYFNEINGPFTALWSLLILMTAMYYGWRGFIGSSLALVVTSTYYIVVFRESLEPGVLVYASIAFLVNFFAVFTAYVFVRVVLNSRKKSRDIESAQRSELMQVNRLNTLLNSISDAVLTLNRYGRITSQNAAAQAFFDTNQSLIGRDLEKLLELHDQSGAPVGIHDMIKSVKSTSFRDDVSKGEGGDEMHLSIQMSRIRSTFDDNEEYGVVVIIRDITKQKTLEEEKDEFISVTSHELRTPIAIAEGSLGNLLILQERGADKKVLHQAAEAAHDQIIYLAKIINDLSTLSRAERGVGDAIEDIDVTQLMHDLYTRYEPEAKAKGLQLDLDVDAKLPHVTTSRLYFEEMMQNFITNAIKYTKEGSVTIKATMADSGRIKCSVKDSGIGISKPDLERIFEKFYRSEDYRTRESSGTGLGLYVVEKLAKKLETKVDVQSRLNHGSTFSFELPLKSNLKPKENNDTLPAADATAVV